MRFEIDHSENPRQPYFWRIVFSNERTAAHSETYVNKSDAQNAINTVKREAQWAEVVDLTQRTASTYRR